MVPTTAAVPPSSPQIFLSYRRRDIGGHARALFGELRRRLGGALLFFDRESIEEGDVFPERLRMAAEASAVCLVLIGPDWLDARDDEGTRRLERKDDFVRLEIATALRAGRFVVPVLFDETPVPPAERLPEELRLLAARDVLTLGGKQEQYDAQVDRLINRVKSALPVPLPLTASPRRYLKWLQEQHSYLDIRGMGAMVAQRMPLAQVYTRLSVSGAARGLSVKSKRSTSRRLRGTAALPEEPALADAPARAELRDVLKDNPHAALIGDPGSGKTTFVRYVAQSLARSNLGDEGALPQLGFTGDAPFPIFVRLSDFASYLTKNPEDQLADDAEEHLCRFLEHLLAGNPHGLPGSFLRERLHAGGCMLLMDGLDEVAGEAMRERMVRLLENVVAYGKQVGNRHLVTCRTRAWDGRVQLQGDVADLRLLPFRSEEVHAITDAWARALFEVPSNAADEDTRLRDALDYRDQLRQSIDDNPSGATFCESPLMLTVLAVVHWNEKQLPEERAELYDRAVKYLLDTRKAHSMFQPRLRQESLQGIALAMFEHPNGVQRAISRPKAAEAVARVAGCTVEEAVKFVEEEELHSGLLVARSEGLEFWHLTFQEYLAALAFSPLSDRKWERLRPHLDDDRWNEVLLLLAGCERRNGLEEARELIARVLETGTDMISRARAVALASRMLRDIAPSGGDASAGTEYAARLRETLGIFEPGAAEVPEPVRIDVGDALGRVGDPRLADDEANRVLIPGGMFWMGAQKTDLRGRNYDPNADDDESPVRAVTVSAFKIGRYPVTVQEYCLFVSAGERGYLNREYWSADGWAWRESIDRRSPGTWTEQVGFPNRPVVFVAWEEADAYARWVAGRLPTESEWEWVARGAMMRRYPWGEEEPTERHANFEGRRGGTTPVGIYPRDAHDRGVRDLAGNVEEWCQDWYLRYEAPGEFDPREPARRSLRVMRGGSFRRTASGLRGAFRHCDLPVRGYVEVGFRVVWDLLRGQT